MRSWASLILLGSAALWGVSWWPMKQLADLGVGGAALALLSYGSIGLLSLPWLLGERHLWWPSRGLLVLIALSSGWAALSFVLAMSTGDVVREMLLFYLSPAWSVLGARFLLHERVDRRRALSVASALAGAFCVIRAGGQSARPPSRRPICWRCRRAAVRGESRRSPRRQPVRDRARAPARPHRPARRAPC